ncbi:MAG: tetratricopeptide repeat protein [Candidatus Latescibacterota bacterium]|nr:MAG: tetratricopeptide repeat protein [Candidatus Latescibacterota bacterium]
MTEYARAIAASVVAGVMWCAGAAQAQHAPEPTAETSRASPRELESERWQSDVRFLADAIRERHPHPFHAVNRETFAAAAERLEARIPELDYPEILAELSRLVAMLGEGDGHSRVRFNPRFISGQYPLRYAFFAEGLLIRSARPDHAALVGKRVTAIGEVPVEDAVARLAEIVPGDNDFNRRLRMLSYLLMPEILQGLDLADADGDVAIQVVDGRGKRSRATLEPMEWPEGFRYTIGNLSWEPVRLGAPEDWVDMRTAELPRALQRLQEWYWMEPLDGGSALYVQLNAIGNQEGHKSMGEFFARVFDAADEEHVERLILDVRWNGGGNNFFNRSVVHGLIRSDKLNQRGRTYVLIGRTTFSAAQNLITKLDHETEAVFVGEPSGGKPNHYGDARRVTLPESGLDVSISTLYWQDGGPFDRRAWVPPDIAVDITANDWVTGRDPVLEAARSVDPQAVAQPLDELLTDTYQEHGFAAALAAYRTFKSDPAHRYIETEFVMNRVGYHLLQNGQIEEAIQVFRLNTEAYPESWNTYDSLGEALVEAGRIEEAITNYERSLDLNPENAAAARMLARLRGRGSGSHGQR